MYCQDGQKIQYYKTMEQLEESLQGKGFIRTHRSYMVNLQYVAKFNTQGLLLKTGSEVPVGGTYLKIVEEAFSDYMSKFNIYKI